MLALIYVWFWNSKKIQFILLYFSGHWVPAATLIALGYVTAENPDLAVTLLTIAVGFNAATFVGFQVNHIDLAPKHAGTMMGITNCAANILSIIAPIMVGYIVTDDVSKKKINS